MSYFKFQIFLLKSLIILSENTKLFSFYQIAFFEIHSEHFWTKENIVVQPAELGLSKLRLSKFAYVRGALEFRKEVFDSFPFVFG